MHRKISKKSQNWSIDVLIAIALIIFVVSIVYYTNYTKSPTEKIDDLKVESYKLSKVLESDGVSIIKEYRVNSSNLLELARYEKQNGYVALKSMLKMNKDFCFYFKDPDGLLLPIIDKENNEFYVGVGSPDLYFEINGTKYYCGTAYPLITSGGRNPSYQ